jgi:nitrite reductase/ring-hydroxylating ferredoxin subunit
MSSEPVSPPEFEDVGAEDELAEGDLRGVRVDGAAVVIARVDGALHAVDGVCTHMSILLEEGYLKGTTLFCPGHDAGFDVRTGAPAVPPACRALATYDVRAEEGRLLVARRPRRGPG